MHDCTGPLTLFSGLHVNAAVPGCCFQETVRAHIRTFYSDLIDSPVIIRNGEAELPRGPGLGTRLNPELFHQGRYEYRASHLDA
jgi:galactonate dehydratase